jgi:outer membrane protein OmpA-like peptidoglycan-associated protein
MRIAPALAALVLTAAAAAAQSDSVVVGGDDSGQTLIDPASGQTRFVPSLLQPWQNDVIHLRPPGSHRRVVHHKAAATAAPAEPALTEAAPPPAPKKVRTATVTRPAKAPTPAPAPKAAAPAPVAPSGNTLTLGGFGDVDLISGNSQKAAPAAPAAETASIEKPKPKKVSGTRKDSITFAPGASDPSTTALSSVRILAATLSSSLGENARVSLMAYAGAKGEKSSDSRRLSLKRARIVRQILIDGGVPAEKIDVYALGGADDDGEADRVDVFLKS